MTHGAVTVTIAGQEFLYGADTGLDPMAILALSGFIRRFALRYRVSGQISGNQLDDLIQAGYLGALAASKTFDPTRGVGFLTYAQYAIHREIVTLCNRGTKGGRVDHTEASFDALLDRGWAAAADDDPSAAAYEAERTALLRRILAMIPYRRALYLRLFYAMEARLDPSNRGKAGKGHSRFKAIALAMGATYAAVMSQCHKGLKNAREAAWTLGAASHNQVMETT